MNGWMEVYTQVKLPVHHLPNNVYHNYLYLGLTYVWWAVG